MREKHQGGAHYSALDHAERHGDIDAYARHNDVSSRRGSGLPLMCLKATLICALLVTSFLLGLSTGAKQRENQDKSNTFMPKIPPVGRPTYFSENKNWTHKGEVADALWTEEREIMRKDRFVKIDEPERYGIPQGTVDKAGGQFYSVSVYHQLHCLAMFRAIIYNTTTATGIETAEDEGWGHLGHCFYYMREAIRCHADSALEWPEYVDLPDGSSHRQKDTPHFGCKQIDVLDNFVKNHQWVNPETSR